MTTELSQADLDAFGAAWTASPMVRYLGIRISFPERTRVVVDLPEILPMQRGGKGTDAINGGVLAMMFDFALGATALLAPPLRRHATVQLSLSFQRAVRGRSARCVAQVDRAARSILFSSAEHFDESGQMCARATGVISLAAPVTLAEWQGSLSPFEEEP